MENVVLIVHLLLALGLVIVVLMQRSEGGGLGMGSGGGSGAMSTRAAATALGKLTWVLAICFICTSLVLTIIAAQNAGGSSVVDQAGDTPAPSESTVPGIGDNLLPPPAVDDAPLVPRAD